MLGQIPIRIDELFTRRIPATEAHPREWEFLFVPSCPGSIHDDHHAAQWLPSCHSDLDGPPRYPSPMTRITR